MLARLTSKNQLTLPKAAIDSIGPTEYFDIDVREGQLVLTPVRIQRGNAVRAKLRELGLVHSDIDGAVRWARSAQEQPMKYKTAKPKPRVVSAKTTRRK